MSSDQPNPYQPPQVPSSPPLLPPGMGKDVSQCAPCPNCGHTWARKIGFTWWGGVLGPKIFHHVKCTQCGSAYNGKTGKSNTGNIVIYSIVGLFLGMLLFGALALLRL